MLRKYNIYPIRRVFIVVILYCTGISGGRKAGKLSARERSRSHLLDLLSRFQQKSSFCSALRKYS